MKLKENTSQIETIRHLIVGSDIKKLNQKLDLLESKQADKSKELVDRLEKTLKKIDKSISALEQAVNSLEDAVEINNDEVQKRLSALINKINKLTRQKLDKAKVHKTLSKLADSL